MLALPGRNNDIRGVGLYTNTCIDRNINKIKAHTIPAFVRLQAQAKTKDTEGGRTKETKRSGSTTVKVAKRAPTLHISHFNNRGIDSSGSTGVYW